ncbi:ribbon-helix-helix protein, CopG family [Deinococcus xianganensis]|uniref:ribbon-helix-helix protein, CopG family n=1 Tax=Deinococcus xianganensis TaxID=1507289 RepID=UPI003B026104
MRSGKTARVGVRLDRDTLDVLRRVAERDRRTVSEVVRDALARWACERLVFDSRQ